MLHLYLWSGPDLNQKFEGVSACSSWVICLPYFQTQLCVSDGNLCSWMWAAPSTNSELSWVWLAFVLGQPSVNATSRVQPKSFASVNGPAKPILFNVLLCYHYTFTFSLLGPWTHLVDSVLDFGIVIFFVHVFIVILLLQHVTGHYYWCFCQLVQWLDLFKAEFCFCQCSVCVCGFDLNKWCWVDLACSCYY